jgi:integrase
MPMGRLTAKGIAKLTVPGRYGDGNGLYLFVQKGGGRSWMQRLVVNGVRRDIGLGSVRFVTLAEARDQAYENRKTARRGGDPFAGTREHQIPTFRTASDKVAAARQWRGRTADMRRSALETHAAGLMGRRVDQIGREDVLRVLTPIWTSKPALARKLRVWIRGVLSWAQGHGHVDTNYAADAISGALPKVKNSREHHAAIPYQDVPVALEQIDASRASNIVKALLRFTVLTACRSSEAREATWDEIDLEAREWRIPAARMKMDAEHRVPLSDAAVAVLEAMRAHRASGLVFASPKRPGKALDASAVVKALQRVYPDRTMHGFRSSFRTWAAEKTNVTRDIAEMALAHRVGSDVERSYAQSDLFEKRRALMAAWAGYLIA